MAKTKPVYSEDFKEDTIEYIIKNGKSISGFARDSGIGSSTLSKWMSAYRKKHGIPSSYTQRGARIEKTSEELNQKLKELEKINKKQAKELAEERETVEILKKDYPSLCNHENEVRGNKN